MQPTIRPALPEDLPSVVALLSADAIREVDEEPVSQSGTLPSCYRDAYGRIAADPSQLLAVAELANEIVGTFQLSFIPYVMYRGGIVANVEAVRVAAHVRGQGVGERMMRWAIDVARERGCVRVQLTTNRARADAHRFYERLGFEQTHVGMKLFLGPDSGPA